MTIRAARPALSLSTAGRPPLRTVFAGDRRLLADHVQAVPAGGLVPIFVELRGDSDAALTLEQLRAPRPDVVLVMGPQMVPAGVLEELDALTVGFLTEPIPRGREEKQAPGDQRLDVLRGLGARDFDRIVSCDPLVATAADGILPVWRSLPLPVADRFFSDPGEQPAERGALLTGRLTQAQERFLGAAAHLRDLVGVVDEVSAGALRQSAIGVNLHDEPSLGFESRVCAYAAAGLLVLTEPLSPTHGLEPGLDFVEVHGPDELRNLLLDLERDLGAFRRVRARGRAKAERFRASRVFPELLSDLLRDMGAFGSCRRRCRPM